MVLVMNDSRKGASPDSPEVLARIHAGLRLVEVVARQLTRAAETRLPLDDLIAAGREGLLDAARRFDAARGTTFEGFAWSRIHGSMVDASRRMAPLPRRAYGRLAALAAGAAVSEGDTCRVHCRKGDWPDVADGAVDEHSSTVATAMALAMMEATRGEPDEDGPEEAYARAELATRLRTAMAQLLESEAKLLQRYYFEERTLDDIAEELGVSRSWASRLHARALRRAAELLQEFAKPEG